MTIIEGYIKHMDAVESFMKDTAVGFYEAHKQGCEQWEYGEPESIWIDEDGACGVLCIRYTTGAWFHYRLMPDGVEWW